jgi:hypothetical protein
MGDLGIEKTKVRVLLAQALSGEPDLSLWMSLPTIWIETIAWLENSLG